MIMYSILSMLSQDPDKRNSIGALVARSIDIGVGSNVIWQVVHAAQIL